jgi:hypothetical protein
MGPAKYLLLATVKDRLPMALTLLASIKMLLPDWRLVIVAQEYDAADVAVLDAACVPHDLISLPTRIGPHSAKVAGLKHIAALEEGRGYIVCSIDDDMEFTARTSLEAAVRKAMQPGVGLVSAGWVKHEGALVTHETVEAFVTQPIVYTGGGLIFASRCVPLILGIDDANYYDDNTEWSLATYLAGLDNFRYRGSVTIHRICRTGGRRAWVKMQTRRIPDPEFLAMRASKVPGNWNIGASADLTPLAKAMHQRARAAFV